MGKTFTPTYRIECKDNSRGDSQYQLAWDCRFNGRPTAKNLENYIRALNASFLPGGVNGHLSKDFTRYIYSAAIERQATGETVAEWTMSAFETF